jgi:hypothetical protein
MRNCTCSMCRLTLKRQRVMATQVRVRRSQASHKKTADILQIAGELSLSESFHPHNHYVIIVADNLMSLSLQMSALYCIVLLPASLSLCFTPTVSFSRSKLYSRFVIKFFVHFCSSSSRMSHCSESGHDRHRNG